MQRDKELIRLRLTAGTRIRPDSLDEKAFQGKEVNTRKPKIDLFRLVPSVNISFFWPDLS